MDVLNPPWSGADLPQPTICKVSHETDDSVANLSNHAARYTVVDAQFIELWWLTGGSRLSWYCVVSPSLEP